jgi:hypothetical protein
MSDHPFLVAMSAILLGILGVFGLILGIGVASDLSRPDQGRLVAQISVLRNVRLKPNSMLTVVRIRLRDADSHNELTDMFGTFSIRGQSVRIVQDSGATYMRVPDPYGGRAGMGFYNMRPRGREQVVVSLRHGDAHHFVPISARVTLSFVSQRSVLPSPNLGKITFATGK